MYAGSSLQLAAGGDDKPASAAKPFALGSHSSGDRNAARMPSVLTEPAESSAARMRAAPASSAVSAPASTACCACAHKSAGGAPLRTRDAAAARVLITALHAPQSSGSRSTRTSQRQRRQRQQVSTRRRRPRRCVASPWRQEQRPQRHAPPQGREGWRTAGAVPPQNASSRADDGRRTMPRGTCRSPPVLSLCAPLCLRVASFASTPRPHQLCNAVLRLARRCHACERFAKQALSRLHRRSRARLPALWLTSSQLTLPLAGY